MTLVTGHFDGKVIVPDGPVDLPTNTKLIMKVEAAHAPRPEGTSGIDFLRAVRDLKISRDDLAAMEQSIENDCERVEPNGW